MNTIKTIEQMLDALENYPSIGITISGVDAWNNCKQAIQAGRALLEELKGQEPVAYKPDRSGKFFTVVYEDIQAGDEARSIARHPKVSALSWSHAIMDVEHLKNHPQPKREWVCLTDEEIDGMVEVTDLSGAYYYDDLYAVVRAAEAKLKAKNTQEPIKWSDYESDGRIIKTYPEKDKR